MRSRPETMRGRPERMRSRPELQVLARKRSRGELSDAEYEAARARLMQ